MAGSALLLRPGAPPLAASWAGAELRRGGERVAKPELAAAEPPVLLLPPPPACDLDTDVDVDLEEEGGDADEPMTAGEEEAEAGGRVVRLVVRGRQLAGPGVALLARLGGWALPLRVAWRRPVPAAAAAASAESGEAAAEQAAAEAAEQEEYGVEVALPPGCPTQGLLLLEPRAGALLGGWLPVLLLAGPGGEEESQQVRRGGGG